MASNKRISARRKPRGNPQPPGVPDRLILEIRQFIAAAIFFNSRAAEQVGLGLTDLQVVHMVQLHGSSTPGRLAAWTGLSSGGVTVALDRLEKAGYVRREPNPEDRRSSLVTLVPAMLRRLTQMYDGIERETRRLLSTLPAQDLEAVLRFFETLRLGRAEHVGRLRPRMAPAGDAPGSRNRR